jgi:hypothetical protein
MNGKSSTKPGNGFFSVICLDAADIEDVDVDSKNE